MKGAAAKDDAVPAWMAASEEQLYGCAALVLSEKVEGARTGAHRELSPATSHQALFTEFAARAAAAATEPASR